jgi:ABC-type nitrate/sulfonate/bicarbonate transport system substrate-binding protein
MRKFSSGPLLLVTVLAMVLVACGGDDGAETTTTTDAPSDETTTTAAPQLEATSIRLATSPPEFDTITDAKWIEILEEAGIEVETFEFETSPDTVRAVAAGEGDLVNTSPLAIMQYIEASGGGLTVIAVELLKTDYYLMATPDVGSLADLQGEIVGISKPGDLSDSLTRLLFEEAGVDASQVEFAQIGGTSARIAALSEGQIAAGAAHAADGLAAAEAFGLVPVAKYVDYIPDYAQRFLAASPQWLEEHPVLAQFIVDKLLEAQRWAQGNQDEYIALSEEHVEGISPEIRSEVYGLFSEGFFSVNGGLETIQPTAEVEQRQGNLSAGFATDISAWVDPSFVESFLERHGEY